LFNLVGGEDMTMSEIDDAAKVITEAVDPEANIIFGATIDKNLKDTVRITVIATGFDESRQAIKNLSRQFAKMQIGQSQAQASTQTISPAQTSLTQPPPAQTTTDDDQAIPAPVNIFDETETPPIGAASNEENDPFDIPAFLRENKGE
jgi:cell division protein FtsZ